MSYQFISVSMDTTEQDQREWLEGILAKTGWKATHLARKAELDPSTLTRFLNSNAGEGHVLTFRTVRKIENAVKATIRMGTHTQTSMTGFGEGEGQPFNQDTVNGNIANAVQALIGSRNTCDAWQITSNDLHSIGLLVDDIVIVDLQEQPINGDVVCAQVYDQPMSNARTVFRIWEPPFLVTNSNLPHLRRPIIVDNTNATLMGVVVGRVSPRFQDKNAA